MAGSIRASSIRRLMAGVILLGVAPCMLDIENIHAASLAPGASCIAPALKNLLRLMNGVEYMHYSRDSIVEDLDFQRLSIGT